MEQYNGDVEPTGGLEETAEYRINANVMELDERNEHDLIDLLHLLNIKC